MATCQTTPCGVTTHQLGTTFFLLQVSIGFPRRYRKWPLLHIEWRSLMNQLSTSFVKTMKSNNDPRNDNRILSSIQIEMR